jgi:hypothetical protein
VKRQKWLERQVDLAAKIIGIQKQAIDNLVSALQPFDECYVHDFRESFRLLYDLDTLMRDSKYH